MGLLNDGIARRVAMLGFLVATVGVTLASFPACSGPKCTSGDLECFLDNIVIMAPENEGKRQKTVSIPSSKLPTRSAPGDGGTTAKTDGGDGGGSTSPTPTPPSPCGAGRLQCNGTCIDVQSDANNCGGCGAKCPNGQPCSNGACGGCPPGDAWCPGTGCTYTGGDEKNCGGCGKACDPRQICDTGICQCRGDNPNCMAGDPPSITNSPGSVRYPDPQTLQPMDLAFKDPNGCQPAFCARLCKGSKCTSRSACVPPVKDGKFTGTWRSYLGFLTEAAADAEFTLGFTPISKQGCEEDLLDQILNGDVQIDVGPEVAIEVKIEGAGISSSSSSSSSSSGSSSGSSSSGSSGVSVGAQCVAFPACTCAAKSCSDGNRCWYEVSGGRTYCAACGNCNAAAQSVVDRCCPKR
jgi:hypothetical protein